MALEKVIESERAKIKKQAQRENDAIDYLSNLINSDYEKIREVFSDKIEACFNSSLEYIQDEIEEFGYIATKSKFLDNKLYTEFKSLVKDLTKRTAGSTGLSTYGSRIETPDIKLGYTEYYTPYRLNATKKKLTKLGKDLVDGYIEAKGLENII